jgi:hypothetical protein
MLLVLMLIFATAVEISSRGESTEGTELLSF